MVLKGLNCGLQTVMCCKAVLFSSLNLANFCRYQFGMFHVLMHCPKPQGFNIHAILQISLLFWGGMNGAILTQGCEVSVNSRNNEFVWQIFLYCHCKYLNSAHAVTGCRLKGRGPPTHGRVWGAWRLVASFGPSSWGSDPFRHNAGEEWNSRIRDSVSRLPGVARHGLTVLRRLYAFGRSDQEEQKEKRNVKRKGTPKNTQWQLKAVDVSTNWRHLKSDSLGSKKSRLL